MYVSAQPNSQRFYHSVLFFKKKKKSIRLAAFIFKVTFGTEFVSIDYEVGIT